MARGVPPPTITWLANGQPLDRTNQRLSLSRDGRHLEIYGSEVVDTGRYTCLAKNEAGIAERHFDLEVLGNRLARLSRDHKSCDINARFNITASHGHSIKLDISE